MNVCFDKRKNVYVNECVEEEVGDGVAGEGAD